MSSTYENTKLCQMEEAILLKQLMDLIKERGDELVMNYIERIEELREFLLLIVLRCRKYNVKSAYERVKKQSYVRKKYPDVYSKLSPSQLYHSHVMAGGGSVILKNRDSKGRQILLLKFSYWDPDKLSLEDMMAAILLLGNEIIQIEETQLNGIVMIVDAAGFLLKHGKHATPYNIYKYVQIFMSANPLKIKGVHLVNASKIFNATVSVTKMFLTQKLRNRIYAHDSSMKSLHKWISPDILPHSLGGLLNEEDAIDQKLVEDLLSDQEKEIFYTKWIEYGRC